LRTGKYVGYAGIGIGLIIMVGAALLPVSPASQRLGPFRVDIRGDNCGPAGLVAVDEPNTECGLSARKRLLSTTAIGMIVLAVGMAFYAGGDDRHRSRIQVPSRRVKRRTVLRSPGSRRYRPG
jgi:hypothetical protein